MKKWMISTAMAALAVVAPAAMADQGKSDNGPKAGKMEQGKHGQKAAKAKIVAYEFRGVVTADATAGSVTVQFVQGNKHVRRALGDAKMITVKIGASTRVRVNATRIRGSFADLKAGDKVRVEIRAPRGTALANLPAARVIVDRGVAADWAPPIVDPPVVEPPVVTPPVEPVVEEPIILDV